MTAVAQKRAGGARGARHEPGKMNKLEADYAAHLNQLKAAGEIFHWDFEKVTLVIADGAKRVRYTPDFMVFRAPDAQIEFHETKGFFEEDAKVKLKVAAGAYPRFVFKLVRKIAKKDGGGWSVDASYSPEDANGNVTNTADQIIGPGVRAMRPLFGDGLVID